MTSDSVAPPAPPPAAAPENIELRTVIFAPLGQDGPLTRDVLTGAGLVAHTCRDAAELCRQVEIGCGVVLLAEEALEATRKCDLVANLASQPPWSDIPIVIVTSDGRLGEARIQRLCIFGPAANVALLERPFRPTTLVSAVQTGLRARRRQYQVRDLLDELRRARDAAQGASRAKDDFLAALSHELRTPLNPVLLLASEAAQDPATPAPLRRDFETIARNVELEARLIDDLLDITRITRGKVALELRRHDVHAAIRDALAAVQSEVDVKSVRVRQELTASKTEIMADRVRFQQVLWNVLKNAVKFTPSGGSLAVTTRNHSDGKRVVVEVRDSGIGMTAEEIAVAFDAFAQGEHANRGSIHRFGGLGLGLAICRMLVELHGGTIRATSTGRDCGSTFRIELPLALTAGPDPTIDDEDRPAEDSARTSATTEARTVLLVEDHDSTRHSLARLLQRRGYAVTSARLLAEAKARIERQSFDLLISDLGLPDGDGCELVAGSGGRFGASIALSGYGMEDDLSRSKRAGFDTHLVKPLTARALDQALANFAGAKPAPT